MSKGSGHVEWYGDQLLAVIEKRNSQGLFRAALAVLSRARELAPVAKGTLRDSGYAATTEESTYEEKFHHRKALEPEHENSAIVAFSAPHAHLLERGTSKMAARPFLRPALDSSSDAVGVAYTEEMRPAIERQQAKRRKAKR